MITNGRRMTPVVVIPAYEPDEKLLATIGELKGRFARIVLVDDGSSGAGEIFFAAEPMVEKLLRHQENRGKGAAIRTALDYIGEHDVVTVDADGQHAVEDVVRVAEALSGVRDGLVLGEREIDRGAPLRSRIGNGFTRLVFALLGIRVHDTQTGLRGIPAPLIRRVAALPGDRYEFELLMLADSRNHASRPLSVPIRTIYIDGNRSSHFRPVTDSVRNNFTLFRFLLRRLLYRSRILPHRPVI